VRYLEAAGARVVPLIFGEDWSKTQEKIDHLNGVFYCGGAAAGDYDIFGKKIFDYVL